MMHYVFKKKGNDKNYLRFIEENVLMAQMYKSRHETVIHRQFIFSVNLFIYT